MVEESNLHFDRSLDDDDPSWRGLCILLFCMVLFLLFLPLAAIALAVKRFVKLVCSLLPDRARSDKLQSSLEHSING